MAVSEEKQASSRREAGKEYYKTMKKTQKPVKVDPKKEAEVLLRKNSVSLSELEVSARTKPLTVVNLFDL